MQVGATRGMVGPSLYQRRVLEFVRSGTGNAVVRATAGAGKTTTLVQVAGILPSDLRACFLAFAKDAATELRSRLPARVHASTIHSLGRRALAAALGKRGVHELEIHTIKYTKLVRAALADLTPKAKTREERGEWEEYLGKLVEYARLNHIDAANEHEIRDLAVRYNFTPPTDLDIETALHERLQRVLDAGLQHALERGHIDFTDMLYVPEQVRLPLPRYDFVCVDEAQDYSAVALNLTMRLVDPELGGRLLFVGDPRQSIYGFAGADTDALERIITRANAAVLPLSISYRCPKSHVALAKQIAPETEARPDAPEGNLYWIKDHALHKWAREGDLILCRNNGPLVSTCLRLVRSGKRARVSGRDLAEDLLRHSRKAFRQGFNNHAARLDEYQERDIHHLRQRLKGRSHEETVIAEREDLFDCMRYLVKDLASDGALNQRALEERIRRTFGEDIDAITLSTVHRAKGQEANRVFILYPELMPASYANTPEAIRGEECVQFVALTRAKRDLVFVERPPREDRSQLERALGVA